MHSQLWMKCLPVVDRQLPLKSQMRLQSFFLLRDTL